ncbi:hypothetical protein EJB05_26493 [Eragrostis curvula]|uniref:Uncharacterized protein n=1 Tax=Eragrostis curvula TaxID=38414 RepID=A0A5J9ULF4_9POAL|nr:hypothetical protein EJB05_26493 [Eragrostis curvula]
MKPATTQAAAMTTEKTSPEKKRKKMERVKPQYVDWLLKREPGVPVPLPDMPDDEELQDLEPEFRDRIRKIWTECEATLKSLHDIDEDILQQYRTKGYAEVEAGDDDRMETAASDGDDDSTEQATTTPRVAPVVTMATNMASPEKKRTAAMTTEEKNAAPENNRTKMVRVKQEAIDSLLEQHPVEPYLAVVPEELLQGVNPELQERIRNVRAEAATIMKACCDEDEDILKQYHTKGYAELEVQASDDDEVEKEASDDGDK